MAVIFLPIVYGCASGGKILTIGPGQGVELTDTPFYPQKEYQCGPASLAMLLGSSGITVHPDILSAKTYLPGRQGSLQPELIAASRKYGRIPYKINPDMESLVAELYKGRPVLILQNFGLNIVKAYHFSVVVGALPDDTIILRSGNNPRLVMDADTFLATWKQAGSWGFILLRPGALPAQPDPTRYLRAVNNFEIHGNIAAAEKAYNTALTAWPDNQTALFALGNNLLQQSRYPEAIGKFNQLLKTNPEHVAAANNLAEALATQGCYSKASEVIQYAVKESERLLSPLTKIIKNTHYTIQKHLNKNTMKSNCEDYPQLWLNIKK